MSESHHFPLHPTRRQWLLLSAGSLTGCGGGAMLADGPPGTGGTGLYAQGAIGGFGSVILNGIRFTDTGASVTLDGAPASAAALRLGMVANVMGQHAGADAGSATSIEVWTIAQGVVTALGAPGSGQFTVAGMALQGDSATVLDGLDSLAQLSVGQRVAVWGLQGGADARAWAATRVAVTTALDTASTGYITLVNNARALNGLLLGGTAAASAPTGQLVRMQGTLSASGDSLAVTSAQPQGTATNLAPQLDCVLAGLITSYAAQSAGGAYSSFMLGNYPVDAGSASINPGLSALALGAQVQVTGNWQNGVLKVSSVQLSSEQTRRTVQVSAAIEQFTSLANFTARGQRFDASAATLSGYAALADFKAGANVQLTGVITGSVVKVGTMALVK
jgi:hypothetical protein